MANPEIPRGVLILILFGFPVVAIATARFGVGAALSAVAAYLFALGVAVVAVAPVDAMSASKDLVVSVSAAAATVIAWKGLQTWKHQSRASRRSAGGAPALLASEQDAAPGVAGDQLASFLVR